MLVESMLTAYISEALPFGFVFEYPSQLQVIMYMNLIEDLKVTRTQTRSNIDKVDV